MINKQHPIFTDKKIKAEFDRLCNLFRNWSIADQQINILDSNLESIIQAHLNMYKRYKGSLANRSPRKGYVFNTYSDLLKSEFYHLASNLFDWAVLNRILYNDIIFFKKAWMISSRLVYLGLGYADLKSLMLALSIKDQQSIKIYTLIQNQNHHPTIELIFNFVSNITAQSIDTDTNLLIKKLNKRINLKTQSQYWKSVLKAGLGLLNKDLVLFLEAIDNVFKLHQKFCAANANKGAEQFISINAHGLLTLAENVFNKEDLYKHTFTQYCWDHDWRPNTLHKFNGIENSLSPLLNVNKDVYQMAVDLPITIDEEIAIKLLSS